MLAFFPLTHLPGSMTAARLRGLSPFLWFAIMTMACKQLDAQNVMSQAATQYVAQRMIVEWDKSLDLLQGLLCILAW